jgi:hypothetical protein
MNITIQGRQVRVSDDFMSLLPEEQDATVDEIAQSMGVTAPQQSSAQPPEAAPQTQGGGFMDSLNKVGNAVWDMGTAPLKPSNWTGAAEGIANDINSGFQGVNPVSMGEAEPVGILKPMFPGSQKMVVDVDGVQEPVENYPADKFATITKGGQTLVIPRSAEGVEEGGMASAGRLLGYGSATRMATQAPKVSQAATDAASLGVTPSFAMHGPAAARVAAAGEQLVTTTGRFTGDAQRVSGELGEAAGRIADAAGPGATPVEAGTALQKGAQTFKSNVKDRQGVLYGAVDKAIGPSTPMEAPATTAFIKSKLDPLKDVPDIAKAVGNPKLEGLLKDLGGGKLTWTAARQLRTEIGESVGSLTGALTDVAGGKLMALYGALTKDLDAAASKAGPEASRVWRRANSYTKASSERIEGALGKILTADSPEKAYSGLIAMTQQGTARSNIKSLNDAYKSLPKEDAAVVSGTIIRRLGQATAGAQDAAGETFSAATFLTNWNKMDPAAKAIVARNGLDKGVPEQLNALARVASRAKEAGGVRNMSNTAGAAGAGALTAGLVTAPISTSIFAATTHLSARALTNRSFLKALNSYAAGDESALRAIAAQKGPLAIEAQTILRLQAPEASSPQSQPREPALAID